MIKGVLFDYGGVLTEGGRRGYVTKAIAELYGLDTVRSQDLKEARDAMYHGGNEDAFFAHLNRKFRQDVTKEMFLERTKRTLSHSALMYALAARLRENDIKTGILSNVFAISAYAVHAHGGYTGFGPVVLSCKEGYAKPELQIYKIAISRMKLPPEEILFIDDQDICLLPARMLGMHTIQAVTPEQVAGEVRQLVKRENGFDIGRFEPIAPRSYNRKMDDITPPQDTKKNPLAAITPDSVKRPVNEFSQKLDNAAAGADDVAKNLEQTMDQGLQKVEKKLDDFLGAFDSFLGKF